MTDNPGNEQEREAILKDVGMEAIKTIFITLGIIIATRLFPQFNDESIIVIAGFIVLVCVLVVWKINLVTNKKIRYLILAVLFASLFLFGTSILDVFGITNPLPYGPYSQ